MAVFDTGTHWVSESIAAGNDQDFLPAPAANERMVCTQLVVCSDSGGLFRVTRGALAGAKHVFAARTSAQFVVDRCWIEGAKGEAMKVSISGTGTAWTIFARYERIKVGA